MPAFGALPEAEPVPVGAEGEGDVDAFNAALEAQVGAVGRDACPGGPGRAAA